MSLYLLIGFVVGITLLVYGLLKKKKTLIISSSILLAIVIIGTALLVNALNTM